MIAGSRQASYRNVKTISECLAEEIINASKGSSNSYAVKKKDELRVKIWYILALLWAGC